MPPDDAALTAYWRASDAIARHVNEHGLFCDCRDQQRQQRTWEQALARLQPGAGEEDLPA